MDTKEKTLTEIAAALDFPAAWLRALIDFESGGNPAARNPISGARGLIQFTHSTARAEGYASADEIVQKYPTYEKQLRNPVYNYLKKYRPFPTKQSLYMAVFYPAARQWPETALFPANVRAVNPNIDTVQDYIDFIEKKALKKKVKNAALIFFLITAAIAAYLITQKKRIKANGREKPARD